MKDKFGNETVPCELCGQQTPMTGTKRCDRCWELEKRINADPVMARKILDEIREIIAERQGHENP